MTNQNARKRKIQADGEPRDHDPGGEIWIFILFYPGKACGKQTFGSTEGWFYLGLKRLGSDARWANRNLLSGRVWALDAKERRVVIGGVLYLSLLETRGFLIPKRITNGKGSCVNCRRV